MKTRTMLFCVCTCLAGTALFAGVASAQTKAFRQTNLSSSVSGAAEHTASSLDGPWAVAFLPGQPFFIAGSGSGSVTSENPSGAEAGLVRVPASGSNSASMPAGIAADASGAFATAGVPLQYVIVTQGGTIAGFSAANGEVPTQATLLRDDSAAGAVYTAVALLHPSCCAPYVAVADFSSGSVRTLTSSFEPLDSPGTFEDLNLPSGYAPYGLQIVGNEIYVTYAVRNAAKNGPVAGAGNGVVNVFDLQGHLERRLAMGGSLNAPWGLAQASANFGPFSGAILIGNAGDGTISAFDASSGNFLGQLRDGDGNLLVNPGIRALAFRSDGGADPNTLFFTAENGSGQGGLFGGITAGLVSVTRASVPAASANQNAAMTVTVAAGPGNPGTPSGTVSVSEGGMAQGAAPVVDGVATLPLPSIVMLAHSLAVRYSGDANFVPSSASMPAATTASFAVAANPTSVSVTRGQSAPVTVTVTPSGGFTGGVSLSCSSVPTITCSFASSTLMISSAAMSTTMNINTTTGTPGYGFTLPGGAGFGLSAILAALALGLFAMARRGQRFARVRVPALAASAGLVIVALSLTLGGCGYGSSYTAPQNAGPAMMTVTATSGSITQTTSVSVTVQ